MRIHGSSKMVPMTISLMIVLHIFLVRTSGALPTRRRFAERRAHAQMSDAQRSEVTTSTMSRPDYITEVAKPGAAAATGESSSFRRLCVGDKRCIMSADPVDKRRQDDQMMTSQQLHNGSDDIETRCLSLCHGQVKRDEDCQRCISAVGSRGLPANDPAFHSSFGVQRVRRSPGMSTPHCIKDCVQFDSLSEFVECVARDCSPSVSEPIEGSFREMPPSVDEHADDGSLDSLAVATDLSKRWANRVGRRSGNSYESFVDGHKTLDLTQRWADRICPIVHCSHEINRTNYARCGQRKCGQGNV